MDYENEEWRDIPGYEGFYQVSSMGRVKSLHSYKGETGRILKTWFVGYKRGYEATTLTQEGIHKRVYIHDLVASAFIGKNPGGYTCNHKDGVKKNNKPDNLEYCTQADNNLHSFRVLKRSPVIKRGSDNKNSKLQEEDVREIRRLYATGKTPMEISRMFPVNNRCIGMIVHRQTWKHID